jgi:PKD repeat protein
MAVGISTSASVDFPDASNLTAIMGGPAPLALNFSAGPQGGVAPFTYAWDFGDGTNSTEQNPSHTFEAAGDYSVVLDVTDSTGATTSEMIPLVVTGVAPPAFTAILNANPSKGVAPLLVAFSTTIKGGKAPYAYYLDFGDGNHTSTGGTGKVNHKYGKAGTYDAAMTVTDANKSVAKSTVPITVS